MENLDPLRQKPDFEKAASNQADIVDHDAFVGFVSGCEHVWTSHVEPLIAKLDGFDSFLDTLNDQAKKEYATLQSRIRELEEENKLLKSKVWTCPVCQKDHLMPDRTCDHGSSVFHHGFNIQSMNTHKIGGDPFPKNDAVQEQQSIEVKKYVKVKSIQIPETDTAIEKYKSDRDKFAIGFGDWIANEAVLGDSSYHKHAFGYGELKTMPELLELYKESLLNRKP